jgi:uncharacterized protein (DUF3820 family)
MNMPFGKWIGVPVERLNVSYLRWLVDNVNLKGQLKTEIYALLEIEPKQDEDELLEEMFK